MTSSLSQYLDRIGWSQAYLSNRIGVHPKTVQRWVRGEAEVPVSVMRYLELVARLLGV